MNFSPKDFKIVILNLIEPGSTWEEFECLDERQRGAINTNADRKVGSFVGTQGKADCLVFCRLFGLTVCEWNKGTGECYAYMKKFSIGTESKKSFCYVISSSRGKIVQAITYLAIQIFVRLCEDQVWIQYR